MLTVCPTITVPGVLMLVTATSVTGGVTGIVMERWLLVARSSARLWLATRSWLPVVAGVQA